MSEVFEQIAAIEESAVQAASVASLRDAPNRGGTYGADGLTAQKLKEKFDELPLLVKDKLHELIAAYNNLVASITNGELGNELNVNGLTLPDELARLAAGIIGDHGEKTIKTIAALSAAIGNDPEFAVNVQAAIQKKADETTVQSLAGAVDKKAESSTVTALADTVSRKSAVKVGGNIVAEFDADAFGVALLAEIVDGAPAALDTIRELADAIGRDPNFATAIIENAKKAAKDAAAEAVENNDLVLGYNRFNGGANRVENGIGITASSISANDTWECLTTSTTIAQFCPRAVIGKTYTITYVSGEGMMGEPMTLGWRNSGTIEWLPSGTSFVLTEEMAGSGLCINPTDEGEGYGTFYANSIMVYEGTEERDYEPCVTLKKSLAAGKLDKTSDSYRVYATDGSGKQVSYGFSTATVKSTIPMRKISGATETGRASVGNDAVPLSQMNEALAEKDEEIGSLRKRVVNLEKGITPDPFYTDASVSYFKDVPVTALPYAKINYIGGMTHTVGGVRNLFRMDGFLEEFYESGGWGGDPNAETGSLAFTEPGPYTSRTIAELLPDLEVGKTYTLLFDCYPAVDGAYGGGMYLGDLWVGQDDGPKTFTVTQDMLDGHMWGSAAFYNDIEMQMDYYVDVFFDHLMIVEGTTAPDEFIPYGVMVGGEPRDTIVTALVCSSSGIEWGRLDIPEAVRNIDGYGRGKDSTYFNHIKWNDDGSVHFVKMVDADLNPLATPDVTDISYLISNDNFMSVWPDAHITAVNDDRNPVPTSITYQLKEWEDII